MNDVAQRTRRMLTQPVDNTFLVCFRVAFGSLLVWSLVKYFQTDLIRTQFIEPRICFSFYGFDWVKPWAGVGMYAHFLVTAIAAACIMVGFKHRLSSTVFFLTFTFIFLLDQSVYLNHYYLISLLGFLLIVFPAQSAFSIDALRNPALRSDTAPAWVLWLLRFQIGVPYFFGGIAKLNSDWFHGEPIRTWLAQKTDFPLVGQFFTQEWCIDSFVWGGLLLDLFAVPLLLWRRTRLITLAAVWIFHGMNSQLFNIGIFPWLMLAATTLVYLPTEGTSRLRFWKLSDQPNETNEPNDTTAHRIPGWLTTLLCGFVALQLVIPFRHFLYPGDVAFTREGHYFSWRMKLNIRRVDIRLAVHYEDGTQEQVNLWEWVTHPQSIRMRSTDQLLQLARLIREHKEDETKMRAEVRGTVTAALNGREPSVLVSDDVDLSRQPRGVLPASWIQRPVLPSIARATGRISEPGVETED